MPEQIVISRPRAEELLRAVVQRWGRDHKTGRLPAATDPQVYQAVYVLGGKPCCLVACVLDEAGLSMGELEPHNRVLIGDVPIERLHIDDAALELLTAVQAHQDEGEPWGEVVDAALGDGSDDAGAAVVTR